ncbi:MAG: 2-hydroxychromene-2-carboxylate isomerase [SAR324 cluster bacterium]|nr:2-hydroxychromene-2-carboxylate isomerase [SAR324 cluster bacterium]
MVSVEFFFDCSSPWTYLGFIGIQPLAKEREVQIEWKPILVGGIFNSINPSVYQSRENPVIPKAQYMIKDLADWSNHYGIQIKMPPTVFPVNSVRAMRGCFIAEKQGKLLPFANAVFKSYWGDDQDISQTEILTEICRQVGLEPDDFFQEIAKPEIKERLKTNTQELIDRGGFGSPTVFVNRNDMYFGNDRLCLIREAILRAQKQS